MIEVYCCTITVWHSQVAIASNKDREEKKNHFHCCISHFAMCISENSWPGTSLLLESSLKHHAGIMNLAKLLKTQLVHCMALEEKKKQ